MGRKKKDPNIFVAKIIASNSNVVKKDKGKTLQSNVINKLNMVQNTMTDNLDTQKNETNAVYAGNVKITYKTPSGKTITYRKHNEGLSGMRRFLCMALAGNFSTAYNDKPTYLDLRCTFSDDESEEKEKVKTVSCLYSPIPLSAPMYYYDNSPDVLNWVTVFDIGLSYNMINYDVINSHSDGLFYFYITSASGADFARLKLDTDTNGQLIQGLLPGTQIIIQWTMKILNQSENT